MGARKELVEWQRVVMSTRAEREDRDAPMKDRDHVPSWVTLALATGNPAVVRGEAHVDGVEPQLGPKGVDEDKAARAGGAGRRAGSGSRDRPSR